jgi:glucokinase
MSKVNSVLAVDLGGTKLCVAAVNSKGTITIRRTEPVDQSTRLAPVQQMVRLAAELSEEIGDTQSIRAAGVVVPGLVRRDGTVWAPNLKGWSRIPLRRLLEKKIGVPVVVDDDRAGAVLGEVYSPKGAGQGKTDVISLIVGTGIGAGIVSGGQLLRGAHNLSGCAGWLVMAENPCGKGGHPTCLETFASGPGVARLAKAAIAAGDGGAMAAIRGRKVTSYEVARLARAGDPAAKEVWHHVAQLLGLTVANLISLFDPEVIVLGGGLAAVSDCFWKELKDTAMRRAQPLAAKQVKLVLSKLGNDANLFGASYLARKALAQPRKIGRN